MVRQVYLGAILVLSVCGPLTEPPLARRCSLFRAVRLDAALLLPDARLRR